MPSYSLHAHVTGTDANGKYAGMRATSRTRRLLHGPSDIVLDARARTVEVAGKPVNLTRLGFDILTVLLERRGEVLTHDELAELAWGQQAIEDHGAIQTGVYRLRLALDEAGAPGVIRAIRGVGYAIDGTPRPQPLLLERHALESALRAAPTPSLLVDPEGRVVLANDAASRLTGVEVVKLERLPSWLDVLTRESWPAVKHQFSSAVRWVEMGPPTACTIRVASGTGRPVGVRIAPIQNGHGAIGALVSFLIRAIGSDE